MVSSFNFEPPFLRSLENSLKKHNTRFFRYNLLYGGGILSVELPQVKSKLQKSNFALPSL